MFKPTFFQVADFDNRYTLCWRVWAGAQLFASDPPVEGFNIQRRLGCSAGGLNSCTDLFAGLARRPVSRQRCLG